MGIIILWYAAFAPILYYSNYLNYKSLLNYISHISTVSHVLTESVFHDVFASGSGKFFIAILDLILFFLVVLTTEVVIFGVTL